MNVLRLVVAGLVVSASVASTRADDLDAREIIHRAVKAAGGIDALEKAQKLRWKMEGTYHGGDEAVPFSATYALEAPKKYKMELRDVFTIVVNGDQGWIHSGGETQAMDDVQLQEQQEELFSDWVASLVPLVKQEDQFKLAKIEGEKVHDRETVGVEVESEEHRDVKLYFDQESHLLLKAEYDVRSAEQGFEQVDQEVIFKDYQDVAGMKMPAELLMLRDGEKYVEGKLTDIEVVKQFDDDVFARP